MTMTMKEKKATGAWVRQQAYQFIQNDPELYREWCNAIRQSDRDDLIAWIIFTRIKN